MCPKSDSCTAANGPLTLDHLVDECQQPIRHIQAKRLGSLGPSARRCAPVTLAPPRSSASQRNHVKAHGGRQPVSCVGVDYVKKSVLCNGWGVTNVWESGQAILKRRAA